MYNVPTCIYIPVLIYTQTHTPVQLDIPSWWIEWTTCFIAFSRRSTWLSHPQDSNLPNHDELDNKLESVQAIGGGVDGLMDRSMDRWTDQWIDGQMDGLMDKSMDWWTNQ